ncbi:MAG: flagellar hook-length control protein FliK [Anaerolineales bacterium]|nr:flagellar hook-length control protein FliK [Anaerolineales bacterium]
MSDSMFIQVAMEANAMPPPASQASHDKRKLADGASFDKNLEKAMDTEPDEEALALATEAVTPPSQSPEKQPRVEGETRQLAETEIPITDTLVEGQAITSQAAMLAVVGAEVEAAEMVVHNQTSHAPLVEETANNATTTGMVSVSPDLVETGEMQAKAEVISTPTKTQETASNTGAQPLEAEFSRILSAEEQTTEKAAPDVREELLSYSDAKSQTKIEKAIGKNDPMPPDTVDSGDASALKGGEKNITDTSSVEIKTDLTKVAASARQSTEAVNTQASSDIPETVQPQFVDDDAATAQAPVSESGKVKASLGKQEGESPPQAATAQRAVQSQMMDAQLKEPARLAEAHTPEMINQITKGIDLLSRTEGQSLRIQLHPENMGKIEIRLSSGSEGVTVTLNADIPMTGNLLQKNLSELRTSLADAGVNLASLSVNSGQQQTTYQESKQWFSGKESMNRYSNQNNLVEELPSSKSSWKETEIDYRI